MTTQESKNTIEKEEEATAAFLVNEIIERYADVLVIQGVVLQGSIKLKSKLVGTNYSYGTYFLVLAISENEVRCDVAETGANVELRISLRYLGNRGYSDGKLALGDTLSEIQLPIEMNSYEKAVLLFVLAIIAMQFLMLASSIYK